MKIIKYYITSIFSCHIKQLLKEFTITASLGVTANNSLEVGLYMRCSFILKWAINLKLDRSEFES